MVAVLSEFDRIIRRTADGVLGAMETMYQRSRIQEESLYYETLKHTGEPACRQAGTRSSASTPSSAARAHRRSCPRR
jgi:hypothetical protein